MASAAGFSAAIDLFNKHNNENGHAKEQQQRLQRVSVRVSIRIRLGLERQCLHRICQTCTRAAHLVKCAD